MSVTAAPIQRGGGCVAMRAAGISSTSASNPRSRSSRSAAYRSASISPRSRSRSSSASRSRYSATFASREAWPGGVSRLAARPRSSGGTTSSSAAAIIIEARSQNRSIGSRRGWPIRAERVRGPGIYRVYGVPARIRHPFIYTLSLIREPLPAGPEFPGRVPVPRACGGARVRRTRRPQDALFPGDRAFGRLPVPRACGQDTRAPKGQAIPGEARRLG